MRRMGFALWVGAAVLVASGTAAADVEKSEFTRDGGYHVFKDELVNSDVGFPAGIGIRVRPTPHRVTLIRPRVSFVPEMLKSVEKM